MSKMIRIMVLAGMLSIGTASLYVSAETVRLSNGEWPPFTSEKALLHQGIISRIVTESFALEGITVEYGFYPWKRSLMYAKDGEWDGSIGWAQDRADLSPDFYFSDPIISTPKVLFSLKDKPLIWNAIEDLQGKNIGVTANYFYGDAFERARQDGVFSVQEVAEDVQNLRKLLRGRFDGFAMEIDTATYLIQTTLTAEEAARIIYHPKLLVDSFQCVIFSKKLARSAYLIEVFNRGLQGLKDSGKYQGYITESKQGLYLINQ